MEEIKNIKPVIISAVDLTHLQPKERTHMVGRDNLKNRREFLIKLFKTGVVVGLPAVLFPGCEPETIYLPTDEEDCPSYTPPEPDQGCACQTDMTASMPPKVINTVPRGDSSFTNDPLGVEIRLDIDKAMDSSTIGGNLTLSPAPGEGYDILFYDLSGSDTGFNTSLALAKKNTKEKLELLDNTEYTVTLKGTVKDINGNSLDGNGDGAGGDDYSFSFTTVEAYESCICQSDCSCAGYVSCSCDDHVSCSCEGNTCYYCSCQFAGCPLYRI